MTALLNKKKRKRKCNQKDLNSMQKRISRVSDKLDRTIFRGMILAGAVILIIEFMDEWKRQRK